MSECKSEFRTVTNNVDFTKVCLSWKSQFPGLGDISIYLLCSIYCTVGFCHSEKVPKTIWGWGEGST